MLQTAIADDIVDDRLMQECPLFLRLNGQIRNVFAMLALIGIGMPTSVLPCLADTCRNQDVEEVSCCIDCRVAESGDSDDSDAGGDSSRGMPTSDGPCECPPTCPAPCGYGKVPCSTSHDVCVIDTWTPVLDASPVSESRPVNPSGERVFHPPRI